VAECLGYTVGSSVKRWEYGREKNKRATGLKGGRSKVRHLGGAVGAEVEREETEGGADHRGSLVLLKRRIGPREDSEERGGRGICQGAWCRNEGRRIKVTVREWVNKSMCRKSLKHPTLWEAARAFTLSNRKEEGTS